MHNAASYLNHSVSRADTRHPYPMKTNYPTYDGIKPMHLSCPLFAARILKVRINYYYLSVYALRNSEYAGVMKNLNLLFESSTNSGVSSKEIHIFVQQSMMQEHGARTNLCLRFGRIYSDIFGNMHINRSYGSGHSSKFASSTEGVSIQRGASL